MNLGQSRSDIRLFVVAAVVLPSAAFLLGKLADPLPGPSVASAEAFGSDDGNLSLTSRELSAQEQTYASVYRSLRLLPFGESPLRPENVTDYPKVQPEVIPIEVPADIVRPETLKLTSIGGTEEAPLAVVDSRVRRIGDRVAKGWTLESVDKASATVQIKHDSGLRATLALPALENERERPLQNEDDFR